MTDLQLIEKYGEDNLPGFYEGRLIPHGPFVQEWKRVIGYEMYYMVSNYGNVISLERITTDRNNMRTRTFNRCELKCHISTSGYFYCVLTQMFSSRKIGCHILVAKAFLPNPKNKKCVNHIRGIKQDNCITQIEWATYSENNSHSIRVLGTKVGPKKGAKRADSKKIISTNITTGCTKIYSHLRAVKIDGFSESKVHLCINGKRNKHKNHKWAFLNN